jgi:hypothetical protein
MARRQSLKRAMTKAAVRVVVYRAVNDILDSLLNHVSEAFSKPEVAEREVKKTKTKKITKKKTTTK